MQEKLRVAIEQYLGRPVRLAVSVGGMAGESIAAIEEKQNDARQQAALKLDLLRGVAPVEVERLTAEQAREAGIEQMIFVTGRGKTALIESTAFRNATLQGAYFMLAARARGLV